MYKTLPRAWVILGIVWLVICLGVLKAAWIKLVGDHYDFGITTAVDVVLNYLLAMSWRPIWRWIPRLNEWVYPDLNGEWEVTMSSNWSRHVQVLDAAAGATDSFDMRHCDESQLAPLTETKFIAKIRQTLWTFEMTIEGQRNVTPLRQSDVVSVDPFRKDGLKRSGLYYFFSQENQTANLSDSNTFYGAASVTWDSLTDSLTGSFWTQRMWMRAMNTAGEVTFKRVSNARPPR